MGEVLFSMGSIHVLVDRYFLKVHCLLVVGPAAFAVALLLR
jgi:hypothetical protein